MTAFSMMIASPMVLIDTAFFMRDHQGTRTVDTYRRLHTARQTHLQLLERLDIYLFADAYNLGNRLALELTNVLVFLNFRRLSEYVLLSLDIRKFLRFLISDFRKDRFS